VAAFEAALLRLSDDADPGEDLEELSDLHRQTWSRLAIRWPEITLGRRRELVASMLADAESDVGRNYERAFLVALDDSDASIRESALEGLWESTSSLVLDRVLEHLAVEPVSSVRSAAIRLLGRFAILAELDNLPGEQRSRLTAALKNSAEHDTDPDVALEAVVASACLSEADWVVERVRQAWRSGEHLDQVRALQAMARQADRMWTGEIRDGLERSDPELRYEAAVAAGASGNQSLVGELANLIDEDDGEVRQAAIMALGELGGDEAVTILRRLTAGDDPDIVESAEEALDVAMLAELPAGPPRVI
jgi:hypothetical protein